MLRKECHHHLQGVIFISHLKPKGLGFEVVKDQKLIHEESKHIQWSITGTTLMSFGAAGVVKLWKRGLLVDNWESIGARVPICGAAQMG